jgi:hypothetical protein
MSIPTPPTPRTNRAWNTLGDDNAGAAWGLARTLERELSREREKVRVLREALDEAQSCGGLTGSIFMQARAALAATEDAL